MDANKSMGLLTIIIGLVFIIFPMFSAELVSIIVGLSLLFFGISAVFTGLSIRDGMDNTFSNVLLVIGIIITILGFIFIFYLDAMSFLVGLQFYIVGFIMIFFGIAGLMSRMSQLSVLTSILVLIMGIIAVALAAFAIAEPIYIAIIIGVVLVIEGVVLLLSD